MNTTIAKQEAFHDLINLHLYLRVELFRGQTDRYQFFDADIVVERTGNPYQWGTRAGSRTSSTPRSHLATSTKKCLLAYR